MRRRNVIVGLAGAAAWPFAARAQQAERTRRIGVLMNQAANDPEGRARIAAFLQGLQQLGWTEGRNVRIEYRWSAGNDADTHKNAAELVALAPDVIFASGTATVGPALQASRTVPIVFVVVADPVGAGFVDSLARPGGDTPRNLVSAPVAQLRALGCAHPNHYPPRPAHRPASQGHLHGPSARSRVSFTTSGRGRQLHGRP